MKRPATVAELLTEIFQDKPTGMRLKEGKIWLVWEKSVGEQIAARARPAGFRDGTLTVIVDNAPWMQQLTYLKKQIIARLNESIGEEMVKDIYLKAGSRATPVSQAPPQPMPCRTLSPQEQQQIQDSTSDVPDPELRLLISSLMGKHLERN
jgi:predicted nucleic acid-binding Zn ribbon protein